MYRRGDYHNKKKVINSITKCLTQKFVLFWEVHGDVNLAMGPAQLSSRRAVVWGLWREWGRNIYVYIYTFWPYICQPVAKIVQKTGIAKILMTSTHIHAHAHTYMHTTHAHTLAQADTGTCYCCIHKYIANIFVEEAVHFLFVKTWRTRIDFQKSKNGKPKLKVCKEYIYSGLICAHSERSERWLDTDERITITNIVLNICNNRK